MNTLDLFSPFFFFLLVELNSICADPSLQILSQSFPSGLFFFFSVCRFLLILCQYDIVRCSHLLFSPHLSFLYCDLFLLFFFMDTGISCFLCLYTIQFALEILSSLCGFILSFLALIFAFPPVLLPKAEQLWYISISNMLSYASPQIKLICSFYASHLLEHLLLASCLALSFNLWIFIVCFSLLH